MYLIFDYEVLRTCGGVRRIKHGVSVVTFDGIDGEYLDRSTHNGVIALKNVDVPIIGLLVKNRCNFVYTGRMTYQACKQFNL